MAEKIDSKKLTQISKDWGDLFPGMKRVVKGVFSRIVGPLEISVWIDMMSGREEYRSISSVRSFLRINEFTSAHLEVYPRGYYMYITWKMHARGGYKEAAAAFKKSAPIPVEGPVTLSRVLAGYKDYIEGRYEDTPAFGHWGFMLEDIEDPALICAWAGKEDLAQQWLDWARPVYEAFYKRLEKRVRESEGEEDGPNWSDLEKEDIPKWYSEMQMRISDPESLRACVDSEIKKHKLEKFPREDLIIDI